MSKLLGVGICRFSTMVLHLAESTLAPAPRPEHALDTERGSRIPGVGGVRKADERIR